MLKAGHAVLLSHALIQKYTAPRDFPGKQQGPVLPLITQPVFVMDAPLLAAE